MLRRAAQRIGRVVSSEASQIRGIEGWAIKGQSDVKLPAVTHGIAGRYAGALWLAGAKAKTLTQIEQDVAKVLKTAEGVPLFSEFMHDPTVAKSRKSACMRDCAKIVGIGEIAANFFVVLADNGRLGIAGKAYDDFVKLMEAHRGEVRAIATAAEELEPEDIADLEASLKKMLKPGQNLLLEKRVDPSIIGGLVVEFDDKYIDVSVAKRLREIEALLSEAI